MYYFKTIVAYTAYLTCLLCPLFACYTCNSYYWLVLSSCKVWINIYMVLKNFGSPLLFSAILNKCFRVGRCAFSLAPSPLMVLPLSLHGFSIAQKKRRILFNPSFCLLSVSVLFRFLCRCGCLLCLLCGF